MIYQVLICVDRYDKHHKKMGKFYMYAMIPFFILSEEAK